MPPLSDRTRLISSATRRGKGRRPVNPPLERASTMLSDSLGSMLDPTSGPIYGLDGLSAASALKAALADLEGADHAFLAPSGLAAVTIPLLALLRPGDEVVASDAIYGPSRRFITRYLGARGVTSRFHPADASTETIVGMLSSRTRVLLMESPASLTFEMADAPALAHACRDRGVISILDNTWAAGLAFRALEHGVDVSLQALTKYASGHSDVLMGSIVTRDPTIANALADVIEDMGWHVSPDDAWLALRGLRTLPLRYAEQARSALTVAEWLQQRPEVTTVLYPPLPGSPSHAVWRRDFTGAASLMGVVLKEDAAFAERLLDALTLFGLGYSWGGFESLATFESPQLAFRQHPPMLQGALIRLHIGLEDPADLIADIEQALARAAD
ncbi:cystathionine beta-lyase [Brevundimonas sp. PAMC22021]|uniref:cystathionine beta-lyase n=1 Tax=Brevundimonas sp. PAMC22021 TaxID=2861285 RepID=UPI001C627FFC|nr:cystathionine beta-lyase [Brevundimonas sp. PAMC22021]QYF87996.1 cystathionine beta-lyase [Brevundimonas sp. PAMC22021]